MAGTFFEAGPSGVAVKNAATGFIVTGGTTTQKDLTVTADATIDQDLQQSASPTFAGFTIDTVAIDHIHNVAATLSDADDAIPTSAAIIDYVAGQLSSAGMVWAEVTADTSPTVVGNGYICNKAGTMCACVLPANAAVGESIGFAAKGATGMSIQAAASDTIIFGNLTTIAAGIIKTNAEAGAAVILTCVTANSVWQATTIVGNWNVETA